MDPSFFWGPYLQCITLLGVSFFMYCGRLMLGFRSMCDNPAAVCTEQPQAILNGVDAWFALKGGVCGFLRTVEAVQLRYGRRDRSCFRRSVNQTQKLSFRSIEMYRVYRHWLITTSIDRKRWPFENAFLGAFAFEARKTIRKASL